MSSSGNVRPPRPTEPPPKATKKKRNRIVTFLISCCLFEAVFCACLLAALVLLGRHYIYNIKDCPACGADNTENHQLFRAVSRAKRDIFRLPPEVIPIHYDITLKPNLENDTFTGRVNITVNVKQTRDVLILNSLHLDIHRVRLIRQRDDEVIPINDTRADEANEILEITPQNSVGTGKYYLIVDYGGTTSGKLTGFYQSSYVSKKRGRRKMATSKFEPTYARQAYPCFDEPNMKAKFTVHLLKPNDESYIALSNMPQDGEPVAEDDGMMVHFQESVAMSTYLSCFIVSDFVHSDPVIFTGDKELRVYATPEQLSKTVYARDIGQSVIEYFTEYFGIEFPLPKLDMAAIPDFVSGAMEHWGLVTFRETALLYSKEISSSANKQRVATVVSHELAHSWFGNLVTMDWWNDLWLNEGFASYIEYKGVDHAEDTWKMLDQFLIDNVHPVLILDATLASHPIVQTVHTPDQITAVFDTISYNKGAAILRMLENAVGEDVFKDGVTKYLKDHEYQNAVTQDLWDALQEITDEEIDITQIMDTWTRQMGYPVIDVTTDGNQYILKQRRYLTNSEAQDNTRSPFDYKWTIPITYITKLDPTSPQLLWFNYTEDEVAVDKPASGWIKFNYHQVGYYRVNYEESSWNEIIADIMLLEPSDRTHLIEETFSLAQSGTISYDIPLDLTKYLTDEKEYVPWSAVSSALIQLNRYLTESDYYEQFKNYVRSTVTPQYEELTWTENDGDDENDGDSHLTRRLRVTILNLACLVGHEHCLNEANQLFQDWLTTPDTFLSPDLRSLVYTYGTAKASEEDWEVLFQRFADEKDAAEKAKLMQGLTYTPHASKLKKLIKIAETDGVVRSQDYFTLMQYISANPVGNPIVWDYVRENWENLVRRFGLNERYLGRMIPGITNRFTRQVRLDEMNDFFTRNEEAGAGAAARQEALQTVQNNINWLKINQAVVENWLAQNDS